MRSEHHEDLRDRVPHNSECLAAVPGPARASKSLTLLRLPPLDRSPPSLVTPSTRAPQADPPSCLPAVGEPAWGAPRPRPPPLPPQRRRCPRRARASEAVPPPRQEPRAQGPPQCVRACADHALQSGIFSGPAPVTAAPASPSLTSPSPTSAHPTHLFALPSPGEPTFLAGASVFLALAALSLAAALLALLALLLHVTAAALLVLVLGLIAVLAGGLLLGAFCLLGFRGLGRLRGRLFLEGLESLEACGAVTTNKW